MKPGPVKRHLPVRARLMRKMMFDASRVYAAMAASALRAISKPEPAKE